MTWDDFYTQLREIDIVDVARDLGLNPKQIGHGYRALCPWHTDKHPSLVIGGKQNTVTCFVCGKTRDTIGLVMEQNCMDFREATDWLAEHYNVERPSPNPKERVQGRKRSDQEIINGKRKRPLPIEGEGRGEGLRGEGSLLDFGLSNISSMVSLENSFSKCMAHVFPIDDVKRVTYLYYLGLFDQADRDDDVMFPSIDRDMVVRDVKIQNYCTDPSSPDFFHCDKKHILWLAGMKGVAEKLPSDCRIDRDCLFGEHLLDEDPSMTVVLVESPKNALLGAAVCPQFIWVATGNKSQLKRPVLEALRGRRVIVIPDRDAHEEWKQALATMQDIATFHVSDILKDMKEEKGDIGDYILIHNSQFIIHN